MSYELENWITLGVLGRLRQSTPARYETIDEIDSSSSCQNTLFYQTKTSRAHSAAVYALGASLNRAPYLTAGTTNFDPGWYRELIGNKQRPQNVLRCSSALGCFQTLAEAFCQERAGALTCDLRYMSDYETKPGHSSYGGDVVVRPGTNEILSVNGEGPTSARFQRELNGFLSSFAVHVVVERHATLVHLAISQKTLMRVSGPTYAKVYESSPAIRALVAILTTRVNEVSINQQLLMDNYHSLVSRAASFTNQSLVDFCRDRYQLYARMAPEEITVALLPGAGRFSAAGRRVYQAAQTLVSQICQGKLPDDVTRALGLMLWNATFYHYFVGDYVVDALMYGHLPLLCTGSTHVQNQKYATLATTIAVTTMTRTLSVGEAVAQLNGSQGRERWQAYLEELAGVGEVLPGFSLDPAYPAVNF